VPIGVEDTQEVVPESGAGERPKRRWWFRRGKPEAPEIPEPPKHVRRLEPGEAAGERAPAESAEERS
jgi:hypothetical protein